ncbi:hypothetical protein LTR36_009005 [Oleoguttula mirabilis]|uniref:Uncharacterized protein n=1 Tax=Oleoguttula mirabilis TaxID=1507867 RepID=A0AAV9J6N9_9PEZI|nr:hypothetical protein LTR36_009005 [Oleoguttula mirabilis]
MARTKQTARRSSEGTDPYHTQAFTDHAGRTATRVRNSLTSVPILHDFRAQPVFVFQIYTTIPLDMSERLPTTKFPVRGTERTVLTDLVNYVSSMVASDAQRPEPVWEIYAEQASFYDCVDHQRREIAHRKARRNDHSIPPIPKLERHFGLHGEMTGFLITIDSLDFKAGFWPDVDDPGPLWVHFERKFPSAISWEPRLRLDGDPEIMASGVFGPPETPKCYPRGLAGLYGPSYHPNDPRGPVQDEMDVAWDEDEGTPDSERTGYAEVAIAALESLAAGLSLNDCNIDMAVPTDIIISNCVGNSEPDLRYVIYVPFLHQPGMGDKLEQVAMAFTHQITSRLSGHKTISFEFCKPPYRDIASILAIHRDRFQAEGYIGALTTFPDKSDERSSAGCVRAHPIARTEGAEENDPAKADYEPYRTFAVVVESARFSHEPGCVLFLHADGGKFKPERDQDIPTSMRDEFQDYVEMQLWRCAGMDEVARRLQMVWGGVESDGDADEEKSVEGDAADTVEGKE